MALDWDEFMGGDDPEPAKKARADGTPGTGKWDALYDTHTEGGGPYGGRNNALLQLVAFFRAKSFPYPVALSMAHDWNSNHCEPPQPDDVIEELFARKWYEWQEGDKEDAKPEDYAPVKIEATKPLRERIIHYRDVPFPSGDLPYLWGPYLNTASVHWLTAQTGVGKSTICYNIAKALAEGKSIWGIDCEQTSVLYVDMESGATGRSLKVQRLSHDSRPDIPFDFVEAIAFPQELPDILAICRESNYKLVIFDTARRCFSVRDENDNAEFYLRIAPVLDSLKAQGVSSLTLGHPAKNGMPGARGAGAQEDAVDIILHLTVHKGEKTDPDAVVKIEVHKNRILGLGQPPLFLRREGDDKFSPVSPDEMNQFREEVKQARQEESTLRKLERVQDGIKELEDRQIKPTVRLLCDHLHMSARDVSAAIKSMESAE